MITGRLITHDSSLLATCHSSLVTSHCYSMSLQVTPVYRNLQTRVTFLYLEFEDLILIIGLAAVLNIFGRFLNREIFGMPMNLFLQYVVPILSVPVLILFKYGKPGGYLLDWLFYYSKPHVYSAIETDREQTQEYLKSGDSECL